MTPPCALHALRAFEAAARGRTHHTSRTDACMRATGLAVRLRRPPVSRSRRAPGLRALVQTDRQVDLVEDEADGAAARWPFRERCRRKAPGDFEAGIRRVTAVLARHPALEQPADLMHHHFIRFARRIEGDRWCGICSTRGGCCACCQSAGARGGRGGEQHVVVPESGRAQCAAVPGQSLLASASRCPRREGRRPR